MDIVSFFMYGKKIGYIKEINVPEYHISPGGIIRPTIRSVPGGVEFTTFGGKKSPADNLQTRAEYGGVSLVRDLYNHEMNSCEIA
jgi:hypothetical protein